ncbi:IS30 family transposase [Brevibacillus reuszeri]|uniref:IS30 family transposase n=1 Tax=Brevibacillus reuszeri TaxID=54915 RepID=A0A0K9YQE2_9BACL|nr:IS30 family transposase [Brevibacillus reuszeri]KNB70395.1 integrase [Brevibacillus reuszeri]MED1857925.1 IS30 family transposase [Brevibacillus reuszeri]GED71792.1 IS30 family transposase [Brevibacillus reuszeri]
MSYSHLSITERSQLAILHRMGWSTRAIATELKRHHSTIARELKRGHGVEEYQAETAHVAYEKRRERSISRSKWTAEREQYIAGKLAQTWSPEQIAGRMSQECPKQQVSFKTIYRWLYQGLLVKEDTAVLRYKGKRRGPVETRGRFNIGKSIQQRPKDVRKRQSFGHWELDTVVSSRGKSKACVATFAERKTRLYLAVKMPDRTSTSLEKAFGVVAASFPKGTFQTATVDRGKEFACYERLESAHDLAIYFADPYSSWQRGTNENANGLLREFFPKGIDFAEVSEEELAQALGLMNNRPRKYLGWKTAHESFMEALSHLACQSVM